MAFIKYKNGKTQVMDPERATKMWLCLNDYLPITDPRQKSYLKKIDRIYLNPANAPKQYLRSLRQDHRQLTFISNK